MLKEVIARPITEADVPIIHAVALEAWQYTYHEIFDQEFIETFVNQHYASEAILSLFPRLRSGTMCLYVAEDASNIIGFCNIGSHQETAELYRIYLFPSYIGQGIGRKLLEHNENFFSSTA